MQNRWGFVVLILLIALILMISCTGQDRIISGTETSVSETESDLLGTETSCAESNIESDETIQNSSKELQSKNENQETEASTLPGSKDNPIELEEIPD